MKLSKLTKDPKTLAIIILTLIALSITGALFFSEKVEPFKIQDRCGVFVNLQSHTIPDQETCQTRCRAECISKDYNFKKVEFTLEQATCNTCMCYCK